jgi:uncharacterized membrane protein
LKPAEVGTLVDEYADDRDIVATIIDLAIRGYLKIRPLGDKDIEIEILREGDDLEGYERKVFEAIKESVEDGKVLRLGESVGHYIGSLEPSKAKEYVEKYKKLHETLESVKDEVYNSLTLRGYFQENPKAVRDNYEAVGLLMVFIALFTGWIFKHPDIGNVNLFFILFTIAPVIVPIVFWNSLRETKEFYFVLFFSAFFILFLIIFMLSFIIEGAIYDLISILHHPSVEVPLGIALAGAIISFIGLHMPRKTERGVEMYKRVLGFKEFIERVEEDRLKRMMEEDPTKLERIIPYAIVLGIENIWIEKISKVLNYIPAWIQTSTRDVGKSISITTSSLSTSLPAVASLGTSSGGGSGFGGGGRSGGGAGGGGGGAW